MSIHACSLSKAKEIEERLSAFSASRRSVWWEKAIDGPHFGWGSLRWIDIQGDSRLGVWGRHYGIVGMEEDTSGMTTLAVT